MEEVYMKWLHLNSSIDNLISKRDIAGLIKAVNNRNAAISTKAVEALIEIGDLISLLKDCDETTQLSIYMHLETLAHQLQYDL